MKAINIRRNELIGIQDRMGTRKLEEIRRRVANSTTENAWTRIPHLSEIQIPITGIWKRQNNIRRNIETATFGTRAEIQTERTFETWGEDPTFGGGTEPQTDAGPEGGPAVCRWDRQV